VPLLIKSPPGDAVSILYLCFFWHKTRSWKSDIGKFRCKIGEYHQVKWDI